MRFVGPIPPSRGVTVLLRCAMILEERVEERRPWNWMSGHVWISRILLLSIRDSRVLLADRVNRGRRGSSSRQLRRRISVRWLSAEPRLSSLVIVIPVFFFREKRSRSRMKLKGAVWNNGFLVGVDGRTIFRDRYWIFSLPSPGNGIGNWLYRQATTRSPPIIYSW